MTLSELIKELQSLEPEYGNRIIEDDRRIMPPLVTWLQWKEIYECDKERPLNYWLELADKQLKNEAIWKPKFAGKFDGNDIEVIRINIKPPGNRYCRPHIEVSGTFGEPELK